MSPRRNVLHTQHSPYLLQHKDNPVWWQPWGDEAFEMARREDKPVFLSIGYSTCYWCHVMEHDSFEHQEVADVLNEHFVCIKVDREELPDVDQIYMDVVLGIHGHGGWPMSVFLTPERKPFWGGTFFYRDPFIKILRALSDAWKNERERVLVSSDELTRYLQSKQGSPAGRLIDQATARQAKIDLLSRFDQTYGGFGGAPKFPPSQQLQLLMQLYRSERDAASEEVTRATLTSMACGGICDQLGGGFHRYSVDAAWLVPHFEKMLYDNALLIPLYLDAYTITNDERFRDVAASACEYLLRDMRDGGGAFFAAEDAGEVGNEGEFYVWTEDEVRRVLSPEVSDRVCATYGITPEGNFEHGATVLSLSRTGDWQDTRHHDLRVAREKLLEQRARRERPHRDDKILTSWNGLCVTAFSRAYKVLRVESYRAAAVECAAFILDKLHGGSKLLRRYCKGDARFDATLEDYAYLIQGLLELYEITGDDQWLERAALLQEEQRRSLWLAERRAFASSAAPGNIVQLCEWADGATPAANAISLGNLRRLEAVTGDLRYGQWADELEQGIPEEVFEAPSRYCSTLRAALLGRVGVQTCCVVTPNASAEPDSAIFDLWRDFCPYTTVVWCSQGSRPGPMVRGKLPRDGRTTWYVCQHRSCGEPVFEFTGDMAAGPRDIRHT